MKREIFWAGLLLLLLVSSARALSITLDGDLSDWRLDTRSFEENDNNWDPGIAGVYVFQEDWVGDDGFVGPGYGGQNYDVEAILLTLDEDYLYLAISTGFPREGRNSWDAGDIAFDVGSDGVWDYALVLSNYVDGDNSRSVTVGGFYEVRSWADVYFEEHRESNPFRMEEGTLIATIDFVYEDDPYQDDFARYFIEAAIPLDLLGSTKITVNWTMECGNDYGRVRTQLPEPASILLVGSGVLVFAALLRKKYKRD